MHGASQLVANFQVNFLCIKVLAGPYVPHIRFHGMQQLRSTTPNNNRIYIITQSIRICTTESMNIMFALRSDRLAKPLIE